MSGKSPENLIWVRKFRNSPKGQENVGKMELISVLKALFQILSVMMWLLVSKTRQEMHENREMYFHSIWAFCKSNHN